MLPFPLVHIDTGHNYQEVIDFRDRRAAEIGARTGGRPCRRFDQARHRASASRNGFAQRRASGDAARNDRGTWLYDAMIGGARRDEEKARAKERIFSFRDEFGQWDPKAQRPELWSICTTRVCINGEHLRVFPISNWTELDIWQYIAREQLELPSIYYAHQREIVRRNGLLVPVTPLTPMREGETSEVAQVRFRTVGDISCTCPVESDADDLEKIIAETAVTEITERGATRMDDQASEAAMEHRKKQGYF